MKNLKYIVILALGIFTFSSCETTDLDLLQDPNQLPPEAVDVDLVMNHLQRQLAGLVQSSNNNGEGLMRMRHFFSDNWNGVATGTAPWNTYYTEILPESNLVLDIATDEIDPLPFHEAVTRVIRAYGAMTLVDFYGDIPFSEAGQFSGNLNPKLDDDEEVYAVVLSDLLTAKDIFENGDGSITYTDYYYDGNKGKWLRLINSLLFKYYLNIGGSTAQLNALINDGLIESEADDFAWIYNSSEDPESRHPDYISQYAATTVGQYMSNYYMWAMNTEKVVKGITTIPDPRTRFYFFRQSLTIPGPTDIPTTQQVLPCLSLPTPPTITAVDPDLPFCLGDRDDVYWGRDVFNVDGIGPENELRTTYGSYPIGGRFDDNRGAQVQSVLSGPRNLNGEGLSPVMLSSYVYFMRAEAALTSGTSDNAASMLQAGINASLSKVYNFGDIPQNNVPETDLALYEAEVMAHYATASDKLDVIAKEALIALWGNGYEAYNMYRRTGRPLNLQPGIQPSADQFPRSFFYPTFSVDGNSSINQKPDTTAGPFWADGSVTID